MCQGWGIAYGTLRDWMRDNKEARNYLKEKVEDHLDQSYFYLAQSAPKVADEMLKMILDPKENVELNKLTNIGKKILEKFFHF